MPGSGTGGDLRDRVLAILEDHRLMSVATLRPDGWPQNTVVGYVHEGLALYFLVARTSQKLANIKADPRVSIAIGAVDRTPPRGLSMAALASEVVDLGEIERLNQLIYRRYPEARLFGPAEVSVALLRAEPEIVSVIEVLPGGALARTVRVSDL